MTTKRAGLILLLALIMVCIFGDAAWAAPRVFVDGREIVYDQPPVIENNRVLVPVRATFIALGADVNWDPSQQLVEAHSTRGEVLSLWIGNTPAKMQVGDTMHTYYMDVPPQVVNGRTLVPLRFVAEVLEAEVKWEGASQQVLITTGTPPTNSSSSGTPSYDASYYKQQAEYYFEAEEYDKAGTYLDGYLKLVETDDYAYFMRGFCYAQLDCSLDAIANYSKAIGINMGQAQYYYSRSLEYAKLGYNDQAANDRAIAQNLNPVYSENWDGKLHD